MLIGVYHNEILIAAWPKDAITQKPTIMEQQLGNRWKFDVQPSQNGQDWALSRTRQTLAQPTKRGLHDVMQVPFKFYADAGVADSLCC